MKVKEVVKSAKEALGIDISESQARRAKKLAVEEIQGSFKEQFAMLWDYAEELRTRNPGSTVKMQTDSIIEGQPQFRRFYICLRALQDGFHAGCRRVLSLDGCFLKGFTKGELLIAVGRDANNQMYPIAWCMVEVENYDSWSWFLTNLRDDLKLVDGNGYTIISDQQKGLINVIEDLLPNAEHRFCAVHLFANWRKLHKGVAFKFAFWKCVKASTERLLEDALVELKRLDEKAASDLTRIDKKYWCMALFSTNVKCDAVENNMVEAFNGKIVEARAKPVEEVREYTMRRIYEQRQAALKETGEIMPRIQKKLNQNITESFQFDTLRSGNDKFQVVKYKKKFSVDLVEHTCGCRKWELSGIPCPHACAAIRSVREKPEKFVHQCYSVKTQLEIYSHYISPCNGEELWSRLKNILVRPPPQRKMPRRPKKNRRKAPEEKEKQRVKISVAGMQQKCSNCGALGHNKRKCTRL